MLSEQSLSEGCQQLHAAAGCSEFPCPVCVTCVSRQGMNGAEAACEGVCPCPCKQAGVNCCSPCSREWLQFREGSEHRRFCMCAGVWPSLPFVLRRGVGPCANASRLVLLVLSQCVAAELPHMTCVCRAILVVVEKAAVGCMSQVCSNAASCAVAQCSVHQAPMILLAACSRKTLSCDKQLCTGSALPKDCPVDTSCTNITTQAKLQTSVARRYIHIRQSCPGSTKHITKALGRQAALALPVAATLAHLMAAAHSVRQAQHTARWGLRQPSSHTLTADRTSPAHS
jgi:hypothetical protein